MKIESYLIFLFTLFFTLTSYSQYKISGYLNTQEKNKTVYLSLLRYDDENTIYPNQVFMSTKTDSVGYFEFKGKLLSEKDKLYRIHSNIQESNKGYELKDSKVGRNYHNFIFSNHDTIFFPKEKSNWFSYSKNSNSSDLEWKKSIEYKSNLLKEYKETKNSEVLKQVEKSFLSEFKQYSKNFISSPLVKLLAFVQINKYVDNIQIDYKENSDYYDNILDELKTYYLGKSYYLQAKDEISKLSYAITKQNLKFHKSLNYWLGIILLLLGVTVIYLFWKLKRNMKKEWINEISTLTTQEKKVAELICSGMSNKEIATNLFVTLSTIKSHIRNIYSKLEIENRQQLIQKMKNHTTD